MSPEVRWYWIGVGTMLWRDQYGSCDRIMRNMSVLSYGIDVHSTRILELHFF